MVWALPDTGWLTDPFKAAKKMFAGGNHTLGVFHRPMRTGEGFENGEKFEVFRLPDEMEQLTCTGHGSRIYTLSTRVSNVDTERAHTHARLMFSWEIMLGEGVSNDVEVGHGYSSTTQLAGLNK